jgi:predicted ester cyclase
MALEDHKAKFRRVVEEAWNKGNTAVLNEVIAPQYVYHTPSGDFKGPEGLAQAVKMYRTAFPDIHLTIDEIVAEGDRLAARFTLTGTFTGELMGIAPTGKRCTMTGALFNRYVDGKEVEAASFFYQLSMFQQLGIKPPME